MKADALICGIQAYMPSSYVSVSSFGNETTSSHDFFEDYFAQQHPEFCDNNNPESVFIEKERYDSLSEEAKQIINIILSGPKELLESPLGKLFFSRGKPVGKKLFRTKLVSYLTKQWKDQRYARRVVQEIEEYVKTF